MLRYVRLAAGVAAMLAVHAGASQAQYYGYTYPYGYGGYGWGGWGAGSTVQGSTAMGMGMFAQGVGQYNVATAQAQSIDENTLQRWNSFVYASEKENARNYYAQLAKRQYQSEQYLDRVYKRLRDNPEDHDIVDGDALNVALRQLLDPKVYAQALKGASIPIDPKMIKDIPFQYASEGITASLNRITSEEQWPLELKDEAFTRERQAFHKTVEEALAEDEKGELTPQTVQKVRKSLATFKAKVDAKLPANSPDRVKADDEFKALAGLSRMLESPDVSRILAEVDKYEGTTLGDLLNFMHAFNVRFAAADSPREESIYRQLYPMLDRLRDEALGQNQDERALAVDAMPDARQRAKDFFKGMEFNHLSNEHPPAAPIHRRPAAKPSTNP